jgi:hypothetical protein
VTTKAWFFPIAHANDANFRAWGSDLSAAFAEVGLVKTADTGQIDWVTVTRPGISTAAGYEIWRYTDSSVFMKIEYGTSNGAAVPGAWLTVGTGSNGSGTLTGTVSDRRTVNSSASSLNSPGTNRQSFLVYKDGFFGFLGYRDAVGTPTTVPHVFLAVAKTTDAAGVQDSRGATVYWRQSVSNTTPDVQALNFQTATALSVNTAGNFTLIPMAITSSIIGADTQCFIHWTALPLVLPNPYMATILSAEVPSGSTFTTTLVGTAPRTYVALDSVPRGDYSNSTAYKLAMLWE